MKTLTVTNPFTLDEVQRCTIETADTIAEKIATLKASQTSWRKISLPQRIKHVQKALGYFELNQEEVARDISKQTGKPITQSRGEVRVMFDRAHTLCELAESALAPDVLTDKPGFVRTIAHEPHGVVFVIAAWNYPLIIAVNAIVAGLLAGNTILLKHSSLTPLIGQHFHNAMGNDPEYGSLLQSIVTDHSTTAHLIEQYPINHVVFTGSVAGGHQIYASVAKRFINCNLELGGKDGAYVAEDANLEDAVSGLVDGAMYNAGQSCCGIERVYVHARLYDAFIEQAKALMSTYVMGDPMSESTTLGPMAQPKACDELEAQVIDAVSKGAKLLCGGVTRTIGQARFFEPTLLCDVTHEMKVMTEENFGPILPVMKVNSDEEGFAKVADSEYGLTAVIYTQSQVRADAFYDAVDAGTLFMNRCDYLDPALPWTGVKNSGKGSALSKYAFWELTRRKAKHFKL